MPFDRSESGRRRRLRLHGIAFLCALSLIAGLVAVRVTTSSDDAGRTRLSLELPHSAPGVHVGTAVSMFGLPVGEIVDVDIQEPGGVTVTVDLVTGDVAGLTDSFGVDFRPQNYFGVTTLNVRPGKGGTPIVDGQTVTVDDVENSTLQALLARLGDVSGGVLTDQTMTVVDKATRYTAGLVPFIETVVKGTDAIGQVQTVSTRRLMTNATRISDAFPDFLAGTIRGVNGLVATEISSMSEDEYRTSAITTLDIISNQLFGAVGKLLSSHEADLLPATQILTVLAASVPSMTDNARLGARLAEVTHRLDAAFSRPDGAVRLELALGSLPALATPLRAAMGKAGR